MLSCILVQTSELRDAFVSELQLSRVNEGFDVITVYRRAGWILVYAEKIPLESVYAIVFEQLQVDVIFLPFFGISISHQHSIGDVILPNVFFPFNPRLLSEEVTSENRDTFMEKPIFLTDYDMQADYLVEGAGISIGGIAIASLPVECDDDLITKLEMAYESDILTTENIMPFALEASKNEVSTCILGAVTEWKKTAEQGQFTAVQFATKNLIRTMRMIQNEDI